MQALILLQILIVMTVCLTCMNVRKVGKISKGFRQHRLGQCILFWLFLWLSFLLAWAKLGDTRQLHATRCTGAVQSGEFLYMILQEIRFWKYGAAASLTGLVSLLLPASGQRGKQNERHLRRGNHSQALQRKDGGKSQHHVCSWTVVLEQILALGMQIIVLLTNW